MPLALTVQSNYKVDQTKIAVSIRGTILITGSGNYPAGGLPIDSVLLSLPEATTNTGIIRCELDSQVASGYIWMRVPATGKAVAMQVPPTGSLTTASPLQQIPSSVNQVTLNNESLSFYVEFLRNA